MTGTDAGLQRFVDAQAGGTYEGALAELRAGRKRGHWIWYVLPQLAGLGSSPTSQHYGVRGLAEARAYLAHPVLGPRLRECATALADLPGRDGTPTGPVDAVAALGSVDALKLRSSMTLFALAAEDAGEDSRVFRTVLDRCCDGVEDLRTAALLGR